MRIRSNAEVKGAPSGKSVRLIRTSRISTPYCRAIWLSERADIVHHALPFGREQGGEGRSAELVADFRAEDRPKLVGQLLLVAGANVHQQRIDDAVAGEGVDLEPALVGRQHLLALHVDIEHALVDPHHLLGERECAS